MSKIQLILFLPFTALAAITNVQVQALSAQAVIRYSSGTSSACTLQASTSSSLSPLLPQVDTAKFTSGNSDAQFAYLASDQDRTFILGQKAAKRGTADGIAYSLALPEATTIFAKLTCGASTASFSFATRAAPLGLAYIDPVQADAANPGEVLSPALSFTSRTPIPDPQTGVQLQLVTLPHDITGVGATWAPYALTNGFVGKSGAGFSGTNFPYTVTNDAVSGLVLQAAGMQFWPAYPFNSNGASYDSDVGGVLDWATWTVVAQSSNGSCPGAGAQCTIQMQMSENGVTADPWSPVITCPLNSTATTCTFGASATANQGGWASALHRFRNGPETLDRNQGTAVCNGTTTVTIGQPTNPLWTNGTPATINGVSYKIASVVNESTVTLQSTCPTGSGYTYNISSLSWIITVQAASSDTITITSASSQWEFGTMPSWPDAGWWNQNSLNVTNSATSYLVAAIQQGLYAVNATTGATALIGTNTVQNNLCSPNSVAFDTRLNVTINYCVLGNALYARTYNGSFAGQSNYDQGNQVLCGSPPCWTQVTVTAGSSLDALGTAFLPTYGTLGVAKGMSCNFLVGINQLNHLLIRCWANNQTLAFIGMFDPLATTNSQSGNAGCMTNITPGAQGCFIAFNETFQNGPAAGVGAKGDFRMNAGPGIVMWQPDVNGVAGCNGCGPLQVVMTGALTNTPTTCPSNPYGVTGANCTTITVSGEPYTATPGPNETGAPGEYIVAQPGQYLTVSNLDAIGPNNTEVIRILIKNSSTSWVVQRGVSRDSSYCTPPAAAYTCGSGVAAKNSSANPVLYFGLSSGEMMWQYLTDPLGANVASYNYDSTAHRATQNGQDIDVGSINGQTLNWPPCTSSSYSAGGCFGSRLSTATPGLLTQTTPLFNGSTPLFPQFQSTLAVVGANPVQFHPSLSGLAGTIDSQRYFNDARPFNGVYTAGAQPCSASNVTGSLWKIASGCFASGPNALHRKIYPTKAHWGWHPLLDVSPAIVSSTSNFTYCVVVNSGECHAGSVATEIYFSVPWLVYPYCYFPGQALQAADLSSVCILDNNPMLDSAVEAPLDDPSDRGQRQRVLTHMFAPTLVNAPFGNLNALPNNQWWLVHSRMCGTVLSCVWLMKRSPEVQDAIDRTNYVAAPITVPALSGSYAMLEWGYLEYGGNGTSQFYCTTRADNCRTGGSPFLFKSETQVPTSCNAGCTLTPSWIPDRVVVWRVLRSNSSGTVITGTGSTQVSAIR